MLAAHVEWVKDGGAGMLGGLIQMLRRHPTLKAHIEKWMTIRGVGPVTALTLALEVGELAKDHANRATLAVERKLIAYLLAVDRAYFEL